MENVLKWIVFGIGLAGSLFAIFVGRREQSRSGTFHIAVFTALSAIVLFLATVPSNSAVFASGMRLGIGILIGGLLGMCAEVLTARTSAANNWVKTISACGTASMALFGTSLIMIVFGTYPQPALNGFLIGAVLASVISQFSITDSAIPDIWLLSSTTLCAATLLAVFRFTTIEARFWWMLPSLLLATAIISAIVFAGKSEENNDVWIKPFAAACLTLVLSAVFAWKIFPQWGLLWSAIAGAVSFALIARLEYYPQGSALSAVLVLAFSAVAFKFLGGFGIGIGMLAAFALLIYSVSFKNEPFPIKSMFGYAFYIATALLLLRLFIEANQSYLSGLDLRAYYTFVALALGAVISFIFASCFRTTNPSIQLHKMFGAWVYGFVAAASPLLIVILWGMKAALGFLIGTLAAQIIILLLSSDINDSARSLYHKAVPLIAVAQISAIVFSGLVQPLSEDPRLVKILILAGVLLIGTAWTVILAFCHRASNEEA